VLVATITFVNRDQAQKALYAAAIVTAEPGFIASPDLTAANINQTAPARLVVVILPVYRGVDARDKVTAFLPITAASEACVGNPKDGSRNRVPKILTAMNKNVANQVSVAGDVKKIPRNFFLSLLAAMGNIAPGWCRVAKDIIALRQQLIPWYGEHLVKGIRSEKNYEKDDTTYGWFYGHELLQGW
jgi:hypothetical protein